MNRADTPEWAALGLPHPFDRSIDREFAAAIVKHLGVGIECQNSVEITVPQGIVRLDFVLGNTTRKIGLNIGNSMPPTPPLSELFRDIAATVYGGMAVVYTFNSKATLYTLDDSLYLLSIAEPWIFAPRSLLVLKTASRIAHDGGEVTRNSIGIEGHFQRDEWDPSHVSDRVFVRRIAAGESSWQQHRDFLERRLHRSIDTIAAE